MVDNGENPPAPVAPPGRPCSISSQITWAMICFSGISMTWVTFARTKPTIVMAPLGLEQSSESYTGMVTSHSPLASFLVSYNAFISSKIEPTVPPVNSNCVCPAVTSGLVYVSLLSPTRILRKSLALAGPSV